MKFDLRLLEAFKVVVEVRSVTQAAAMLGVTQPAVSAQLARLEELVGFPLFDRAKGRLKPTNEGLSFYEEVTKALGPMQHLGQVADDIRVGGLGRLAIASNPSAGIALLPALIADFARRHPEISIRLVTRNSDVVRGLFPSQSYDIGIAELPIDSQAIEMTKYRLRCVAALPQGHPLAAHKVMTPRLLSGLPFFAISRERPSHYAIAHAFAEAGAEFKVIGDAELFSTICAIVTAGSAVSVVDPWTAALFADRIVVRPFEPLIPYDIGVFHSADRRPSVLASRFLEALDRHLRATGAAPQRPGSRHAANRAALRRSPVEQKP